MDEKKLHAARAEIARGDAKVAAANAHAARLAKSRADAAQALIAAERVKFHESSAKSKMEFEKLAAVRDRAVHDLANAAPSASTTNRSAK